LKYCRTRSVQLGNLTRGLALEFGGQVVKINAANPSVTLTEMNSLFFRISRGARKSNFAHILRPAARPEQIASVIAFLASEDASFINGVSLLVDGGSSASSGQAPLRVDAAPSRVGGVRR
jgi:meso-butanediol dehydrogenase/(S,S)-butanediol dehydrogenase/diacetyl reductase